MMCYPTSGYIILSLRKLKFYGDPGPGVGGCGPDMRAGGQGPDNPSEVSYALLKLIKELRKLLS